MRRGLRNELMGLAFISPWLIGFAVFTSYPIIASFYYSLCHFDGLSAPRFVGLANYREMLTRDSLFWTSVWNTLYYGVLSLAAGQGLALGLAALFQPERGIFKFFRAAVYLPSIVPIVASAAVWLWLFNPDLGLVNHTLGLLGLKGPGWLLDARWAKIALVIIGLWGVGPAMLIYLAALKEVPKQYYEAATIDGASRWQQFVHVTLPSIRHVIAFNSIMGLIAALQFFAPVYVMTNGTGQPQDSTMVYTLYLFRNAFINFKMGYACAMAWVLFVVSLVSALLILRISKEE